MKKFILIAIGLFLGAQISSAQKLQKSPKSTLAQVVGTTEIKVVYHRPGLKGRKMDSLAPKGEVWRTGANQATEISFSKDVSFGGNKLPAGTYSLYSIPGEKEWTIIVNSKLSWGTQYTQDKDVYRFKAPSFSCNLATETFTIDVSDISNEGTHANLTLRWGNIVVKAPIEVFL